MEEISITPNILNSWTQTDFNDNKKETLKITNIFLQIKDINFFQFRPGTMDELSKTLLRKSIQIQYNNFIKKIEPSYLRMDSAFYAHYSHINYIDSNDTPLEHCMINNCIYPQNGTGFMNYYNRGIIDYLVEIGFTSDMDKIKNAVDQYKSSH